MRVLWKTDGDRGPPSQLGAPIKRMRRFFEAQSRQATAIRITIRIKLASSH
jgi:hypothetical protein